MDKNETMELFADSAKETGEYICRQQCLRKDCNGCPIAQYKTNNAAIPNEPNEIMEGMFAVCAMCDHSGAVRKDDCYELTRTDRTYESVCLDCPLQMARDALQENLAEARMS